jgi:hypothetical protein
MCTGEPGSLVGGSGRYCGATGLDSTHEIDRNRAWAMRRAAGSAAREGGSRPATRATLGADHPLTRAAETSERVWGQVRAVAAVLVGSTIDVLLGRPWAAPLAGAAAVVLAVLALIVAACRTHQRDRALDLILEGRDDIPVTEVQRQRTRLSSERTRRDLSLSLKEIVRDGASRNRRSSCRIPPLFDPAVVTAVAEDLRIISRLLLEHAGNVRGIALTELLVTRATSPLYGRDVVQLREELRRVKALLAGTESGRCSPLIELDRSDA